MAVKYLNFSRKTVVVLSVYLGVIILCGMFYSDVSDRVNDNAGAVTYTSPELTPLQRQKYESEIRLKEELLDFDENIVDASIYLGTSDNEITSAAIFIVSREEVTNEDELMSLASESLDLNVENIDMISMDVETYISGK